jgi:hypothetical protein
MSTVRVPLRIDLRRPSTTIISDTAMLTYDFPLQVKYGSDTPLVQTRILIDSVYAAIALSLHTSLRHVDNFGLQSRPGRTTRRTD